MTSSYVRRAALALGKTARLRYVSRDPPRFVGANLSSPQLFFEVLDGHSVDNSSYRSELPAEKQDNEPLVTGG